MGKNKNPDSQGQIAENQKIFDKTNESSSSTTGFNFTGNTGRQPGIFKSKKKD
ncbi:hypothetical protein [Clostridium sp. 'White wine YQ']|uniref:hypothetical protein n=1 Tax=Clostridium sp. 'White wine YQ' TaxID=3027474 RepID=UPI002366FA5C|nr:hypothetical protein [Clostridium sp. 'White wine YQ']MDD7796255.1 hypothetical protein [Clostridium sp. 'White wine YQ']